MRRFGLLSLGLHAVLLAGLLYWFRHADERGIVVPDKQPTVELFMVEQKGAGQTTPPAESTAPAPTPSEPTAAAEPLPPPPPLPPDAAEPVQVPAPAAAAQPGEPAERATRPLEINIGGTDSETNAIVFGDNVIPAGPDTKYHNRQPIYPVEAVRRAEQGAVVVLVHIAPNGLPRGVDVAQSSGYARLDEAARDAVATWHFMPAVKDGAPIPFDMQFRVVFQLE